MYIRRSSSEDDKTLGQVDAEAAVQICQDQLSGLDICRRRPNGEILMVVYDGDHCKGKIENNAVLPAIAFGDFGAERYAQ